MTKFDIAQDLEIIKDGGIFCLGCLIGKPATEISHDPRYCRGCYDFLLAEAELFQKDGKTPRSWYPHKKKAKESPANNTKASPVKQKGVAKLVTPEILPLPVTQHPLTGSTKVIKHPGGRPWKSGEVCRSTEWRRKKVEKERQLVLV